jgi:tripartite-type tricarboxylate transporter receptor subunit TctC
MLRKIRHTTGDRMKHAIQISSRLLSLLLMGYAALVPMVAAAQYPDRPIRFIVASGAGSSADVLSRIYAEKLKVQLGQPVVVENRPGATGAIGADAVAKAPGDGYTILLNSSALTINPWIARQPFNVLQDLSPIARTADTPYIVTVNAQTYRDFDQFLAHAKTNPGKVQCATYGIGSPPHLALELFKRASGAHILHIPYKTSSQAIPEILSGQLDCIVEPPPGAQALIKSGRLRVIAHTGAVPSSVFADAEPIGRRYPSAAVVGWQAILAPSSTPKPVLERLRTEFAKVIDSPDVQARVREAGFQPATEPVEEFANTIRSDYEKFGKIIKDSGIKLE